MHPFGREAATSLEDLFQFFKNCLHHAEWELASACVPQLVRSGGRVSEELKDIVRAIVCDPYDLQWQTLGSAHRLAWFWLQVLERWTDEKLSSNTRQELEFLLLLEDLQSEGISETILKELHKAFLNTAVADAARTASFAVVSCLQTLLEKKLPGLAHSLTHFLQDKSFPDDQRLQQSFLQHLQKKLSRSERRCEHDWVDEVYAVLAVTPLTSGGAAQFEALCETLWAARDGPLKEERVLGSLLRPQSHSLVTSYCSTALRLQRDQVLRSAPDTPVPLPETEKLILSLCLHEDRGSVWKMLFFECLNSGKHFLEQVLITALDLVKNQDFSQLRPLLSSEFQPLCRLVLLLGWTQCRSLSSAQTLLQILHHQQAPASDSVLRDFADLLSSQLWVLEWCQKNNPGISSEAVLTQLHTLDTHSSLYLLHVLTPLAEYEERRILDLLQQNSCGADASEAMCAPGVQKNVVLFQGFCAMKYAIYALCVNAHQHQHCDQCSGSEAQQPSEPDQNQPSPSSEDSRFQHYLSECQLYLEAVPAMFRLELLESIFSLLFLSSSDFSLQTPSEGPGGLGPGGLDPGDAAQTVDGVRSVPTERPGSPAPLHPSYLDLGHLVGGCRGFLADVPAMEGFLKLLKEGLEGMSAVAQQDLEGFGRAFQREADVAESLGCTVTAQTFGARLQRLSKRHAEAQWRLQVVRRNQDHQNRSEHLVRTSAPLVSGEDVRRSKSLKRRKKPGRRSSVEKKNEEVGTSASDGAAGSAEVDVEHGDVPHTWLVPAMLSPPESLLISCIRRGNFTEARQVSLVFDLESSSSCGELIFMERYKDVLLDLAKVEQKMESQSMSSSSSSSEGPGAAAPVPGRSRLGSSGRSTLQAIGSAAAAGVAFYSISDIADRLLSTPACPMPSLEETYWSHRFSSDPAVSRLLEELSPAAMATFDLACCHCQLWRTSRQMLDMAERRLNTSLETRGVKVASRGSGSQGICGFPVVLQQMNKILNHCGSNKNKPDAEDQVFSNPFGCCLQEVLLCSHPTLTEESIAGRLGLSQRLETILQVLGGAVDGAEAGLGSVLLQLLEEQASLKPAELDLHPVRTNMKQLLRTLDQLCPFESDGDVNRPDYVRSFLDYVNTLASVLVRSLRTEEQSGQARLGNPLLVLLQAPHQLLSYLLFERQVSPDRVLSLLQQEGLQLSVQEVIVQRCCESLPVWEHRDTRRGGGGGGGEEGGEGGEEEGGEEEVFGVSSLSSLLQTHAQQHTLSLGAIEPQSDLSSHSEASEEESSSSSSSSSLPSSSSSSSSFLLTSSALSFLKSRSPLMATLACLSASRGEAARAQASGWSGYFRGRKEAVLDGEQISREADHLLKDFPILRAHLQTMVEPVLGSAASEGEDEDGGTGLGALLCGRPVVGLLLSGPQGGAAQAVARDAFQQALASKDLGRALRLLELYGQHFSQQGALRDRLLACAALQGEGVRQLFRVQDPNLRGRVALESLENWPLASCLELLDFCLLDTNTDASVKSELELKKKELDIFQLMLNIRPPLPWTTWQELRVKSESNSESVLTLMLETKEFEVCMQWVDLYPVSDQSRLELQTQHLLHLLEEGQTEEAFQLLEGLSDSAVGLDLCERALDRLPGLAARHFLADFLTVHFQRQVSSARRRDIHALHLGSKVLLTLPPAARQEYFSLLSEPLLMLEQLLMNLKVEWADLAVSTLRTHLPGQEAGFGPDDIDKLLSDYACRALDFSCAPRERTRSDSVISLQDALLQCTVQDTCSLSSVRVESQANSANSTPTHSVSSNCTDKDRVSADRKRRSPPKFQPPDVPPPRKDWVPDTHRHVCMICHRERFTMFNRRHHCRRCGRLVCQSCSEHKMAVDGCPGDDVRVCDQCFHFFHPDSDDDDLEPAEVAMATDEHLDGMLHLPEVVQRHIHLSTSAAENTLLRSEFYYEQAPSAHLCVAILSLHSDLAACGHQLIDHCCVLSRKLTNPEVDACLLTDIMRQLLFSAKLMFVKVGRNQDLALCDSYISKVDVLNILVSANYKYVPSLDDILETTAVTRLRNQLLESEYYQLAVEVSTKSALDPAGVWHAWGMAALKAGNLSGAREKFSRCLKAPVDRNHLTPGPVLLQEIVRHLETSGRASRTTSHSDDILSSLRDLEEALNEGVQMQKTDKKVMSSSSEQECLFYLNTYGTHLSLVSFYMRHDCVKEALTYLLNKNPPEDVFLEGVLQPSLERGCLGMLLGILEKLDPSLESSSRYLIASCQFLQRRGYFHTLYQLQQFMMDHVRSAMTCIRFFTHGASSYQQLGEQQRWLVRAKEHLRTYLQEQQGRGSAKKKTPVNSFRKMMSSSDVSRHMNTIELQLEVTRFLRRCEAPEAAAPGSPPTLFGGSPMKVEVACKVMLGGKNIEEGFGISYRVVQDFQLEARSVYERVGQRLMRRRQYASVRQLLKCVGESGTATRSDCDALVLSCVAVADKGAADAKEVEALVLETKSPENKIKAYLLCGKLRPAYLLAVKLEARRAGPLVQEVLAAAEEGRDSVMMNICRQWLTEHHNKIALQRHR